MRRTFAEHIRRPVSSLDGLWQLKPDDGTGTVRQAMVPGVWERIPALADFHGKADYERTVEITAPGNYLLRMGGVSHTAHVYWDEEYIGQHYNAFTGFDILLENVPAGPHRLRVNVDNRFSGKSTLHIPNDYHTYGGINRSAELHQVGRIYIDRMLFSSVRLGENAYRATVRVCLHTVGDVKHAEVTVSAASGSAAAELTDLQAGKDCETVLSFDVSDITEWDVLKPSLYDLTAHLYADGEYEDDLIDHIGFRTVEIRGEHILLNGRPVWPVWLRPAAGGHDG